MKLTLLTFLVSVLPYLVQSNPQITQSCSGSHCVQNNVGRRKREIVAEILTQAVEEVGRQERSAPAGTGHGGAHHQPPHHEQPPHHNESPQHHESSEHHKRSADPQISQNCAGSHCNQSNLAGGLAGFSTGFFPSVAQNCVGSACNQNNVLGRRKREVLAQLIGEARKIAEEGSSRKKRAISQNCVGSLR